MASALFLVAGLLACGAHSAAEPAPESVLPAAAVAAVAAVAPVPPAPVPPAPVPPAPVPPAMPDVSADLPASPIGSWQSASCGQRTWLRSIQILSDGTWTGTDLISPCPVGVSCIWSGVVTHAGTWTSSGTLGTVALTLSSSDPATAPGSSAVPTTLRLSVASEGGTAVVDDLSCSYTSVAADSAVLPSPATKHFVGETDQAHP